MACVDCGISVPGDDAARVLVQLAARRVPRLPGARRDLRLRSGARRARRPKSLADGAIAPWARGDRQADRARRSSAAADLRHRARRAVRASCRRNIGTSCCSARRDGAAESARGRGSGRRAKAAAEPFGKDFEGILPNLRRRYERGHVDATRKTWSPTARSGRARVRRRASEAREPRRPGEGPAVGLREPADRRRAAASSARSSSPTARPHRRPHPAEIRIACASCTMSASAT